ncbi:MAG: DNA polymerase III subunit delta' [Nitrospiraceae bacterium]|nr:MAG: DNA polymerase III subunit delta' [Nitrospiraceae bacterium]
MPFHDCIGHQQSIAFLQSAVIHERLAHAYLFHGEEAIGKRLTAIRLAQALNCERPPETDSLDSCGTCRSCQQIEARTHPDFFVIEPDQEQVTQQIKIEQIREIEHQIMYRPLIGERKICLIDDADRMTIGAANALLKTLEEPPAHSLFLAISSRPSALPATIRSRCQALRFTTPARTQVEAALILKREIPPADARFLSIVSESRIGEALTADVNDARARQQELTNLVRPQSLRSIGSILSSAEAIAKADRAQDMLGWLARWIRDLVFLQIGGDRDQLLYLDDLTTLESYARQANTDSLLDLLREIELTEQRATRHLNLHMALEMILLRLRDTLALAQVGAPA